MNAFMVLMPGGQEAITECFPEHFVLIDNMIWSVASDLMTTVDVCNKLDITSDNNRNAVVIRINEYYGRWNVGLWQKLSAWGDLQ